jgi:hypothetical protein
VGAGAEAPSFTVNSDWLQGDLADDGTIEHVLGRGSVRAERKSATAGDSEPLSGTLTGPEVETWLMDSIVKVVEARQGSTFSSSSARLDASEKIRIEPVGQSAGSIRTSGKSVLDREGLHIDGQNFSIDVKGDEQTFNTASRATLKSADLTTNGNVTSTRFDTKTKTLTFLHQSGNVTFKDEKGGRSGSATNLTVLNGGDRIEMDGGKPRFNDKEGTLDAQKIVFERKKESFMGDGAVRMAKSGKERGAIILANHVEGSSSRLDYTGTCRCCRLTARKSKQITLRCFRKRRSSSLMAASKQPVKATRSLRNIWRQARRAMRITPEILSSSTESSPSRSRKKQKTNKKVRLELRTRDLVVHSKNGDVETIIAREGVDLTQGLRKGHGSRLEYNVTTGDLLLEGTEASQAEVREGLEKSVTGCSIHIKPDGGKDVKSCKDRSTTSSFPVKN